MMTGGGQAALSGALAICTARLTGFWSQILLAFDCTPDAELAFTYAIDHLAAGDIVFLTNVLPPGALDSPSLDPCSVL
jgi:hypothetical protein